MTFVNRNLEPYRGYHQFMRALPEILARRPRAQVVIVGGDDVSYGPRLAGRRTWKEIFLGKVRDRIDLRRVHFVGKIPHPQFVALLQVSTVHVYLTYPFVLSWSLLEAMRAGAAIVARETAPLRGGDHARGDGSARRILRPGQAGGGGGGPAGGRGGAGAAGCQRPANCAGKVRPARGVPAAPAGMIRGPGRPVGGAERRSGLRRRRSRLRFSGSTSHPRRSSAADSPLQECRLRLYFAGWRA